jgi:hypothetical protein
MPALGAQAIDDTEIGDRQVDEPDSIAEYEGASTCKAARERPARIERHLAFEPGDKLPLGPREARRAGARGRA